MSGEYGFSVSGNRFYAVPDIKPAMNSIVSAFDKVAADVGSLALIKQVHQLGVWTGSVETLPRSQVVFVAPVACYVSDISFVNAATLTAHNTNFAELTALNKGAGGGTDEMASIPTQLAASSGTGHWAAYAKKSMGALSYSTLSAGQAVVIGCCNSNGGVDMDLSIEVTAVRTDLYAV